MYRLLYLIGKSLTRRPACQKLIRQPASYLKHASMISQSILYNRELLGQQVNGAQQRARSAQSRESNP